MLMIRSAIKYIALVIIALLSQAALAQQAVVNDVKKSLNQLKMTTTDYSNAIKKLKPALTHEQTATRAETWFVAAKADIGLYNKWVDASRVGKQPNLPVMNHALIDAYSHWEHALSLDTTWLVDKHGEPVLNKKTGARRYKTKYSKEIAGQLAANAPLLYNAGNQLFNLRDWQGAYDAWRYYCRYIAPGDTLVPAVRYYQAIALWQQQQYGAAASHFAMARRGGYRHIEAYDYALSCLEAVNDTLGIVALAREAYSTFGTAQPRYLRIIINDHIKRREYVQVEAMIDSALSRDSLDAELLVAKGFIVERRDNIDAAFRYYERALAAHPDNRRAIVNVGRYYYNKATTRNRRDDIALDYYRKALPLFEQAYRMNSTSQRVRAALRDIYYQLGMASELEAIERD